MLGAPDRGQPVPSATLRLPTSSTNSHAIPMERCECSVGRGTKPGSTGGFGGWWGVNAVKCLSDLGK